ncbi:hypothetical protein LCGC14_0188100 [marine sediment metagenome]|uniref:Uncharacterized protein n=1 Tax=marine sediment metagenome TaxID=412755 RepID=A0A0F9V445_9ZZZZ
MFRGGLVVVMAIAAIAEAMASESFVPIGISLAIIAVGSAIL